MARGRLVDQRRDDGTTVTDALVMAFWRRGKALLSLSKGPMRCCATLTMAADIGEQFQRLMADNGVTCSTSQSGNAG